MPKLTHNQIPSYRLHRQSGQAIATLNGKDVLLGTFNSAASKAEYARRIAEWIATTATVAQPDIQKPIRAEEQIAAVVIGERLFLRQNHRPAARIGYLRVTRDLVARNDGIAIGIGVIDVEEAVGRELWVKGQP